jgi:hypothetical protein
LLAEIFDGVVVFKRSLRAVIIDDDEVVFLGGVILVNIDEEVGWRFYKWFNNVIYVCRNFGGAVLNHL